MIIKFCYGCRTHFYEDPDTHKGAEHDDDEILMYEYGRVPPDVQFPDYE